MAVTGDKIVSKALKYLGNGGSKFWKDYGLPVGTSWCCAFVWDIFRLCKASKLFYGGNKTAYVPTAQQWLKKNCKHVKMTDARPGDVVIFTWTGNGYNSERGSRDHIGFIRSKGTSNTAYTIEGNTSGSKVAKRSRAACYIYGIYRPNYPKKKASATKKAYSGTFPKLPARGYFKSGDTGTQVKNLQKFLNWCMDAGLAIDGVYGTKTRAAVGRFEKKYGLTLDYLFGKKCLAKAKTVKK